MKFQKIINTLVVTSVITLAANTFPEYAQAVIKLRHSGSPNGGASFLEFNIDSTVSNTSAIPNIGLFENAVIDAKYRCTPDFLFFCNGKSEITLKSAKLEAVTINSEDDLTGYPSGNFVGGVKYEARLEDIDSSDFYELGILVKPNNNIDILTSLSNLNNIITANDAMSYVGVGSINSTDGFYIGSGGLQVVDVPEPTSVPEPDTKNSLLGAGIMSMFLLLRKYIPKL